MACKKDFIDLEFAKNLWERIKTIPNNSIYTLNDTDQTINGAINDIYGTLPEACTDDDIDSMFKAKTSD